MKSNVILLVIDSVDYNRLVTAEERGLNNLFINKFEKQCVRTSNMYSQAPYTEAATMALYCGQRTMDNGGYLERFNNVPETIFESFSKNKYDVFFNGYQPHIFPSSLIKGINHFYYNTGYDFKNGFWYYRLKHYREIYNDGKLTEDDFDFLLRAYKDNFEEWKVFLERWIDNDKTVELIRDLSGEFNADKALTMLNIEIERFYTNEIQYIKDVFQHGEKHILFTIPTVELNQKIKDRDFLKETSLRYKKIIKKAWRKNFFKNLMNNLLKYETIKEFGRVVKKSISTKNKECLLRYCYSWYTLLFDPDLKKRIDVDYDYFKVSPDIDSHMDHFINWYNESRDSKTPYFACVHVEGMHNPEVIFSHDSLDRELLDTQFKNIDNYLDDLPKNYKGAITYDLSLIHHSERIEHLYNKLCNLEIINENTYFIITADHGYSFTGDPVRDRWVANFYLENYNIPFMIYNSELKPSIKGELCSADDIAPTLLDLCNLEIPSSYTGKSVLSENYGRDEVFIEYMGAGCPDMSRREIHYATYDKEYFISAYVKLEEELNYNHINNIYNIAIDRNQLNDLRDKVSMDDKNVCELFNRMKERHNELRKENKVL